MYSFYNADYILIIKFLPSVPRQEISESSFVDLDFFIHLKITVCLLLCPWRPEEGVGSTVGSEMAVIHL